MTSLRTACIAGVLTLVAACGRATPESTAREEPAAPTVGTLLVLRDTTLDAITIATGIAEPFARATVSTKLTGAVLAVLAREGERVRTGDPLVRIDAREIDARRKQIEAGIASTEAMQREAQLMAVRMRKLFADSAAARVQLDAAEAALARADAAVASARAGQLELDAIADYAVVRAPFNGVVTQRFVDVGAFAAPGSPLIALQDESRLRLVVTVAPATSLGIQRGARVPATIEGAHVTATIEGIVPMAAGSMYTINAVVDNGSGTLLAGGSATIGIKTGTRTSILVPVGAVRREGDLTGVTLVGNIVRWVKVGQQFGASIELLSGVAAGDTILVPVPQPAVAR